MSVQPSIVQRPLQRSSAHHFVYSCGEVCLVFVLIVHQMWSGSGYNSLGTEPSVAVLDCPVQPPCFCTTGQSTTVHVTGHVHRISCGIFSRRRRFPRFVETNDVVERLALTYSGLTMLPYEAFQTLKVFNLDLQGNNFGSRVSSKAFSGISKSLMSLNLAWNNITRLPGKLLRGMVSLRNLSLAENRIRRLASFVFQDLRSLERLSMAGNPLVQLEPDVFRYQTNLYTLDLGYCSLDVLPWNLFNGLWNLHSLDLRGNRLRHLEDYSFSDLYSLQTLLLSHNLLQTLSARVLIGLNQLRILRIDENSLHEISDEVFKETMNVEVLDLGDNQLSGLKAGTLLSMPRLTLLSLDGNQLVEVPSDVRYLSGLRHLDVSYNNIQTMSKCLMDGRDRLEYLNLRENPFRCDCSIFWLRGVRERLLKKWTDKSHSIPFVPGKCQTPDSLRDIPITSWIDLECLRTPPDTSLDWCNEI